ncbi:DoxX family protein [Ferruginibacter sp.]
MFKKISFILLPVFYIGAGINHFWHPANYYTIIPDYLPNPVFINLFSGALEIILGILFLFAATRKIAAYGIIALLIAFIPAHIVMIQNGFCLTNGFCLPVWALWFRLFPSQFLLMWWAWKCRK